MADRYGPAVQLKLDKWQDVTAESATYAVYPCYDCGALVTLRVHHDEWHWKQAKTGLNKVYT